MAQDREQLAHVARERVVREQIDGLGVHAQALAVLHAVFLDEGVHQAREVLLPVTERRQVDVVRDLLKPVQEPTKIRHIERSDVIAAAVLERRVLHGLPQVMPTDYRNVRIINAQPGGAAWYLHDK